MGRNFAPTRVFINTSMIRVLERKIPVRYLSEPNSSFRQKTKKWGADMKRFSFIGLLALSLLVAKPAFADERIIAHGENPQGKSFFAYTGLVSKKDAGWQNASMDKGIFEMVLNEGVLDVRFVDASKSIKSVRAQGGNVTTLNKGEKEATILVAYPAETIETYTFYTDNEGQNKFIMTQVKSGPNALITQSSIFTGACQFVEFDKFPD